MCTAVSRKGLFGRTLDLERSYGERVVFTPRRFDLAGAGEGYALLGMAHIAEGQPLYYDAMNEAGLGMAGLNFPGFAHYEAAEGRESVPAFSLLGRVLRRCAALEEVRGYLEGVSVTGEAFAPHLPATPLHWMVSDGESSLVIEQTAEGLRLYDDPLGVLTNSPPFPQQLLHLSDFMHLTVDPPQNRLAPAAELPRYSRGLGAVGLPGDWSSRSRFVRSAFVRRHMEGEGLGAFFRLMDTVAVPRGAVRLEDGSFVTTRYTSCCDLRRGVYAYTTYESRGIHGVWLRREDPEGSGLRCWPLAGKEWVRRQN